MKKRILSMLLALVMVLSLVPTTVFAAGAGEDGWTPVPTGIKVTYNAAENTSTRALVNNNTETYGNTEYKIDGDTLYIRGANGNASFIGGYATETQFADADGREYTRQSSYTLSDDASNIDVYQLYENGQATNAYVSKAYADYVNTEYSSHGKAGYLAADNTDEAEPDKVFTGFENKKFYKTKLDKIIGENVTTVTSSTPGRQIFTLDGNSTQFVSGAYVDKYGYSDSQYGYTTTKAMHYSRVPWRTNSNIHKVVFEESITEVRSTVLYNNSITSVSFENKNVKLNNTGIIYYDWPQLKDKTVSILVHDSATVNRVASLDNMYRIWTINGLEAGTDSNTFYKTLQNIQLKSYEAEALKENATWSTDSPAPADVSALKTAYDNLGDIGKAQLAREEYSAGKTYAQRLTDLLEAAGLGGSVGDISWTVNEQGVMTVTGTGTIDQSFKAVISTATSVVIGEGITAIEKDAFTGMQTYTTVDIPESVTSIADGAFNAGVTLIGWKNHASGKYVDNASNRAKLQMKAMRVLAIGNSHTGDHTRYISDILKDLKAAGLTTDITFTNLTPAGGRKIILDPQAERSSHYAAATDSSSATYQQYANAFAKTWDVVILQDWHESTLWKDGTQGGAKFINADGNTLDFDAFTQWMNEQAPGADIVWFADWADKSVDSTLSRAYAKSVEAMTEAAKLPTEQLEFIIPASTALENARTSYMGTAMNLKDAQRDPKFTDYAKDALEKYTILERDSTHMSLELGRYLMGTTTMYALIEHYGAEIMGKVNKDNFFASLTTNPKSSSTEGKDWKGDVTPEIRAIIKDAVVNAVEKPLEVTPVTGYDEDPIVAKKAAVEKAAAVLNNATKPEGVTTAEGLKDALITPEVLTKLSNAAGVTITKDNITAELTAPVNGTPEDPLGTDGVGKLTLRFEYGYAEAEVVLFNDVVSATPVGANALADAKTQTEGILTSYMKLASYEEPERSQVQAIQEAAKTAIQAATNKTQLEEALNAALDQIDAIQTRTEKTIIPDMGHYPVKYGQIWTGGWDISTRQINRRLYTEYKGSTPVELRSAFTGVWYVLYEQDGVKTLEFITDSAYETNPQAYSFATPDYNTYHSTSSPTQYNQTPWMITGMPWDNAVRGSSSIQRVIYNTGITAGQFTSACLSAANEYVIKDGVTLKKNSVYFNPVTANTVVRFETAEKNAQINVANGAFSAYQTQNFQKYYITLVGDLAKVVKKGTENSIKDDLAFCFGKYTYDSTSGIGSGLYGLPHLTDGNPDGTMVLHTVNAMDVTAEIDEQNKTAYKITVDIQPADVTDKWTVEYSEDGVNWSTTNPEYSTNGTYTVYYRVGANGEVYADGSADVILTGKALDGDIKITGTSEKGTYNQTPISAVGSVVVEYVTADQIDSATADEIKEKAESLYLVDQQVFDVTEINLFVKDGSKLYKINDAELSENITLLLPYKNATEGMKLYHWNGTGFDGPIATTLRVIDSVSYLEFQYNKFSPFVIVGGVGYNAITATTGEGYTVTYTGMGKTGEDYTFTVTVDTGYTLQSVKANGNAFTATDPTYVKVSDSTYTIKNLNDNYKIEVKVTKEAYTVTYNKNASVAVTGMPDSISGIAAGSSYIISNAEPSRAGYTFQGWATTSIATAPESAYAPGASITVTNNVALYAVWQQNTVQVTLPASGTGYTIASSTLTVGGNKNVTEGSTQTFTVTVTAGYDPATMIVTANGVPLAVAGISGNVYTYKFKATEDTTIAVSAPTALTYTISLPVGDSFTATLTKVDGTAVATADQPQTFATIDYGKNYTFTVTAKENYEISAVLVNGIKQTAEAGGSTRGTQTFIISGVAANQTIQVEMKDIIYYTVTYVIDGSQYLTQQVEKGADTTLITPETRTGYQFKGWYTAAAMTGEPDVNVSATPAPTPTINNNITYYGKYVAQTFQISFNANGGDVGSVPTAIDKVYGQAAQLPSTVPTRTGYTFLGWGLANSDTVAAYAPGDTYSAEITSPVTLYAVWKVNTYTVTLPSGTGYSISTTQSTTVEYNKDFTFTVTVDRDYSTAAPAVKWTKADGTGGADAVLKTVSDPETNPVVNTDGSKSYTYTMTGIKEDRVVSVTVKENATYTVTFYTWKNDGTTTEVYQTQQVEDTYKATQPAAPVIEGYTFGGWYTVTTGTSFVLGTGSTPNSALDAAYSFDTPVKDNLNVVAEMVAIKPVVTIPANGTGWEIDFTDTTGTPGSGTLRTHTHAYNADCTFTVTILEGYDASNMQVGANGLALAPISIEEKSNKTVVYTYNLVNITADTTITVVGVVRKTVTITYDENADDHVAQMPGQQVINQYIETAPARNSNETITTQIPTRVGYEFKGWSTKSDLVPADYDVSKFDTGYHYYAKGDANTENTILCTLSGKVGVISRETKDTTLYAIWKAVSTSITLAVSDVAVAAGTGTNAKEYEGQKVTLTATIVAAPSTGSVIFYQSSDNGTTWTVISSQSANGSDKYTFEATTGAYSGTDTYKVAYKAESAEGYGDSTSGTVSVDRLSTTITWKLNGSNEVDNDGTGAYHYASTIAISGLTAGTAMTAGQTYTLTAPAVYELGTDYGTVTPLKVGTDYTITWQYLDGANGWKTLAENQTTSDYQVTSEYSKYQFRALMVVNTGVSTVYTKAAKFASEYYGARQTETMSWLISEPTPAVVRQATTTALEITGADKEAANQVLFGATKFSWGDHLVQYENQTVTLKATVTDNATDLGVNSVGKVYFYRYTNDGVANNDVLLNANGQGIKVGPDGIATMNYTMPDYDSTKAASDEENCSRIYAVYVEGVTYDTSASVSFTTGAYGEKIYGKPNNGLKNMVFSMSTAIKTPVINSALSGKRGSVTGATSTSYTEDLTELQAGVKHTFTLKTTGANTTDTADWSVVALDGRTVAAENYDIQWNVKTGDNTVTDATVGGTFVTTDNKVGDEISVTLIAKNDMKVDATSKKAIIGTKQDVNVTVTASDEIASTTGVTDAYQLDEVTLTAVVAAKETGATMPPTGTVIFYYSVDDGAHWTQVGDTTDLSVVAGKVTAKIKTTQLPVKAVDNTKQTVKVTAIYHGDSSFFESGTYNADETITENANAVLNDAKAAITIYSSVVYVNDGVENKSNAVTVQDHTSGIYISVIDGVLNANETNVTLKLSDVYTLDHDDPLSKLAFGTDYSVQWQKLSNAAAYTDYAAATGWANIPGKTTVNCDLVVEQGAAYRAVITVGPETDINRGSYTKVDQDIVGRQVYYSNVLVAGSGALDLTVTINTSKTGDGFEGIVEGETVTINTFASGATNTTPISELTVTVTKQGETYPVFEKVKTDVNGYTSFDWATTAPGYYTLEVKAVPSNGYAAKTVTRTLIVRDDKYDFEIVNNITSKVYNGKAQGLTVNVTGMATAFDAAADASVVVYYYSDEARTQMVEPSDAGTYYATIRLQESAYWTEKTQDVTFFITKRPVSVVDLVAQAKVYDGTTAANLQEIVLNDATVNAAGVPIDNTGVLNGDSIYATGTGQTSKATAGTVILNVTDAALKGNDAKNYELVDATYGETFVIQRNQLKGDIADATYAYTGSSITVPADDIAVIDQQGNNFTDYKITYYYHNGDGVEKVGAMKELGLYTVVVTPKDTNNYKGGAAQKVYVASAAVDAAPSISYSATISITNTVELFGHTTGVVAKATKGDASVQYYVNGDWTDNRPTNAGRYLVKASVTNSTVTDTAYGIYTIVKADPALSLSASDAVYNSALQTGSPVLTGAPDDNQVYYTWTGGTIQGVSYTAPTEVGTYVVTAHVNETANNTAHEVSDTFEIKPVTLTIKADSYQRHQYGEYPQMTATFSGLATGGVAPDTSLRDVQIQPEFRFSGNNDALDQAGNYIVTPVSALARNYTVEYVDGLFTVNQVDGNPELAICGMISNGDGDKTIAYYGDVIQLYAYGSQSETGVINNSSVLTWSSSDDTKFPVTQDGLLTINDVGTFTVTLTRGVGAQKISTTLTITALKQEVKVIVPEENKVYSGTEQTYTTANGYAVNGKLENVTSDFNYSNTKRTDIGTQVVTGKVADTIVSYQSETYGGRFTVNDKDVTVTPDAKSVVYGDDLSIVEDEYTVTGEVGSAKALTDTNVASVRELYNNLDVANQYEILVTGTENINYNVKYVTAPTAPQVTVNDKALTVKTGVINSDGRTSGYMEDNDQFYKDEGYAITGTSFNTTPNDRMYGEINPVMDYLFTGLVGSDNEADLKDILDWLVKYSDVVKHNINGDANVAFVDAHLTGYKSTAYLTGMDAYYIDGMLAADGVKNYTTTVTEATQNIYQRPVTLTPRVTLTAYKPSIIDGSNNVKQDVLLQLLLNNLVVGEYNGKGGLATLLGHTIEDLNIQIVTATYNGTDKIDVTIKLGNTNYWTNTTTFTVNVDPSKIVATYGPLGWTSASVTMIGVDESGNTTGPVNVTGTVTYLIYAKDTTVTEHKYSHYKNLTPVRSVTMTSGGSTGYYIANYGRLSAGDYVMFAIAEGYTIIE